MVLTLGGVDVVGLLVVVHLLGVDLVRLVVEVVHGVVVHVLMEVVHTVLRVAHGLRALRLGSREVASLDLARIVVV